MSDPVRLREAGGSFFEVAMLDAARDDVPGSHVAGDVHAALGLGVVLGMSATTSAAGAAGAAGAMKGGTAMALVATAKWIGVCAVAGVALGVTSVYVSPPAPISVSHATHVSNANPNPNPTPTPNPNPTPTPTPTPNPTPTPTPTPNPNPNPNPTPNPNPIPVPVPNAIPIIRGSSVPSPSSSLLLELSPLDAARSALDSGDTSAALAQLDRHDAEFPHGQLAPEALSLRIEVHAARHEDAKARELAARFVARYPEHPQAARMRTMSRGSIP